MYRLSLFSLIFQLILYSNLALADLPTNAVLRAKDMAEMAYPFVGSIISITWEDKLWIVEVRKK